MEQLNKESASWKDMQVTIASKDAVAQSLSEVPMDPSFRTFIFDRYAETHLQTFNAESFSGFLAMRIRDYVLQNGLSHAEHDNLFNHLPELVSALLSETTSKELKSCIVEDVIANP